MKTTAFLLVCGIGLAGCSQSQSPDNGTANANNGNSSAMADQSNTTPNAVQSDNNAPGGKGYDTGTNSPNMSNTPNTDPNASNAGYTNSNNSNNNNTNGNMNGTNTDMSSSTTQPDNTGVNARDRAPDAPTAGMAGQNQNDVDIMANIRRQIMHADMSTAAENVKIVCQDGKVTLRGPVNSDYEKQSIGKMAANVVGNDNVDNELEVKPNM